MEDRKQFFSLKWSESDSIFHHGDDMERKKIKIKQHKYLLAGELVLRQEKK